MFEFTDRVPASGKANRKKITHSDGSVEYVTIENADDANPVGTPLNKATFEAMQTTVKQELQRCVVKLTIPGRTKGWDNTKFIKFCELNVDHNMKFVTAMNCYDYGSYLCRSSFINGNGAQLNLYNSNSGDDVDIQINENFEVFARANKDYDATLIFENAIAGSVNYI